MSIVFRVTKRHKDIIYYRSVLLETLYVSISSGNGPEECCYAASLIRSLIIGDIDSLTKHNGRSISVRIASEEPSEKKGNILSSLLAVEVEHSKEKWVEDFLNSWKGTIQLIWKSAYRPHHKRKNWFISVKLHSEPENNGLFSLSDVRFETARSGGPGGQNVNKTETAVRAVHIPTGRSVISQDERSQLLNKKTALARLAILFEEEKASKEAEAKSGLRHTHYELERGSPVRVYDGNTHKFIKVVNK
jgi:peptide chain release factor